MQARGWPIGSNCATSPPKARMMWSGPSPRPSKMVGPHDHLHGALHLGISALPAATLARVAVGPQMLLGLFYNLIATWLQLSTLRPFRVAPNAKVRGQLCEALFSHSNLRLASLGVQFGVAAFRGLVHSRTYSMH